jgi:peptidoglycan-N-acetylglucosamine deacetylase
VAGEPYLRKLQQNRYTRWIVLGAVLIAATASSRFAAANRRDDAQIASALSRLRDRDYAGAVRESESLLRQSPADSDARVLSALLDAESGSARSAQKRLLDAAAEQPNDSRIQYLLGLTSMALSDWAGAEARLNAAEKAGGDAEAIRRARRSLKYLSTGNPGAEGSSAVDHAIEAMNAAAQKRWADAARLAKMAALDTEGGEDPFYPASGPQFSLNAARPITATFAKGEPVVGAAAPDNQTISGAMQLSPTEVPAGTAYASYQLDGGPLSIVGTRPFSYTWDTTRATNGRHVISILMYDANGTEIMRIEHTFRVFNRSNDTEASGGSSAASAALWQALRLQPDRAACAYIAASAAEHLGRKTDACLWYLRCAAINPDYLDVHTRLAAVGGVGRGGKAVFSGPETEKVVALTFDDGPRPGVTEPLLDLLAAEHVPATFFVIGRHITEFPDLAKATVAAGMEMANHSYTHRSLTAIAPVEAERELLQTQATVLAATGKLPVYMRPPGGNWNNKTAALVKRWGLVPCMWTVDVFDSEIIGAQKVAESVLKQVRPGAIVLMHNGKVSTLQALPAIIKGLRARGYRFVTVETLCSKGVGSGTQSSGRMRSE